MQTGGFRDQLALLWCQVMKFEHKINIFTGHNTVLAEGIVSWRSLKTLILFHFLKSFTLSDCDEKTDHATYLWLFWDPFKERVQTSKRKLGISYIDLQTQHRLRWRVAKLVSQHKTYYYATTVCYTLELTCCNGPLECCLWHCGLLKMVETTEYKCTWCTLLSKCAV